MISPTKKLFEGEIKKATLPSSTGIIQILPHHTPYFSLLTEGIITLTKENGKEEDFAIDKGYVETNGKELTILVSKARGETDLDEQKILEAIESAKKEIADVKDKDTSEAEQLLRRSMIDMKLLKKRKR